MYTGISPVALHIEMYITNKRIILIRELVFFGQPCNDLVDKAIGMANVSSGALNDDVWRVLMRNIETIRGIRVIQK
jgi:hypothetical protein